MHRGALHCECGKSRVMWISGGEQCPGGGVPDKGSSAAVASNISFSPVFCFSSPVICQRTFIFFSYFCSHKLPQMWEGQECTSSYYKLQNEGRFPSSALESIFIFLKVLFAYFQREGEGERKRRRETSMCGRNTGRLPHVRPQPSPQPRHVSQPGIEPATLPFAGQCSTCWATPARAGIHL